MIFTPLTRVVTFLLIVTVVFSGAPSAYAKGFPTTASASDLKEAYEDGEVRILIVPGHEPQYGGAVFMGVYEREIVVEVAEKLKKELEANPKFEVVVARDNTSWNPTLKKYFDKNMKKIESFVKKQKKEMAKMVKRKKVKEMHTGNQVDHAAAPTDVALRLYGINKWVNENDIDLVVNLHVNDATDHGPTTPGANSGFAIYIPDHQYGNGKASRPVAEAIAAQLEKVSSRSTLRIENQGVVEDQELIAIGANNTLKVPTVLIEYGYITEARFREQSIRNVLTTDAAYLTRLGLERFFGETTNNAYPTKALPRTWSSMPIIGTAGPDIYALQLALREAGFYPPQESTLVECPIAGQMNECTMVALRAYQKSKGLVETGILDASTRAKLNAQFGK